MLELATENIINIGPFSLLPSAQTLFGASECHSESYPGFSSSLAVVLLTTSVFLEVPEAEQR